jgi:Fcf2 pre-rRNA processing
MRSVLDPKRHYKRENNKSTPPEFSQIGTVIEGSTEFLCGRIAKKDRKRTLVEENIAIERQSGRFRDRYKAIQAAKTSGKRAYYKSLLAKRRKIKK